MRPGVFQRTAVHLLFGAFTVFLIEIALGITRVWPTLDAGIPLKVLIVLQTIWALSFTVALWRATVLWITLCGGTLRPWPLRAEGDSPRDVGVKRWRRIAVYAWCAGMVNMLLAAILM